MSSKKFSYLTTNVEVISKVQKKPFLSCIGTISSKRYCSWSSVDFLLRKHWRLSCMWCTYNSVIIIETYYNSWEYFKFQRVLEISETTWNSGDYLFQSLLVFRCLRRVVFLGVGRKFFTESAEFSSRSLQKVLYGVCRKFFTESTESCSWSLQKVLYGVCRKLLMESAESCLSRTTPESRHPMFLQKA